MSATTLEQCFFDQVGGRILRRIGIPQHIKSFDDLIEYLAGEEGEVALTAIMEAKQWLSSGELPVVLAVLWRCGYPHLADEMADGRAFQMLCAMDDRHKLAFMQALDA